MMELLSGECDHQTVMKNMCAECGADLEQDMSIVPSANKPNRSQISIVHSIPELKISSNVSLTSFHAIYLTHRIQQPVAKIRILNFLTSQIPNFGIGCFI
jgi:hypothetical protein